MKHNMGLYQNPFQSMKSGRKTVEVRLNDNKRRKLQIGDTIEFTRLPDRELRLLVEVVDLRKFDSFCDMYQAIPPEAFDAQGESIDEMVENTYEIYSAEQERMWGTLAITIRIIEK